MEEQLSTDQVASPSDLPRQDHHHPQTEMSFDAEAAAAAVGASNSSEAIILTIRREPNSNELQDGPNQDRHYMSFKNASQAFQMQHFESTSRDLTLERDYEEVTMGGSTHKPLQEPSHDIEQSPRVSGQQRRATIPQEVQTSFRPSIKDSAEFRKIGQSILKLSAAGGIIPHDNNNNCSSNINFKDFELGHQQFGAEVYYDRQSHQPNQSMKQYPSTRRRKASNPSDNQSIIGGPTFKNSNNKLSSRVSNNIGGKRPSSTITQPGKNQVLRQIYISVNTYDDKAARERHPPTSPTSKRGGTKSPKGVQVTETGAVFRMEHGSQIDLIRSSQQFFISSSRPRSRAENAKELQNEKNRSLIIQPILLGVRAVNRVKDGTTKANTTKHQYQEVRQISTALTAHFCPHAKCFKTLDRQNRKLKQIEVSEILFDETQINIRRNKSASRQQQNLPTKVRIKTVPKTTTVGDKRSTTSPRAQPSISDQQQKRAQSMPSATGGRTTITNISSVTPQVVDQSALLDTSQQYVLGPQVLFTLSPMLTAEHLKLCKGQVDEQAANMMMGAPLVIDSKSRMGRYFLEEQRKRQKMQKEDGNYIKRRLSLIKKEAETKDRFRFLTANKKPVPHMNKQLMAKVESQMKKEEINKEMAHFREIAWQEHLWENQQHQQQNQIMTAPMSIVDRADTLMSSNRQKLSQADQQTILSNRYGDFTRLEPWNQNQHITAYLNDVVYTRPLSSSSNKSIQPPSTVNVAPLSPHQELSYSQLDDKSRYRPESNMASQIAKTTEISRQLINDGQQEIQDIIYKTLNQTDILQSAELKETLAQEGQKQVFNDNPNAIVLRVSSLKEIVPVLHESTVSPRQNNNASASKTGTYSQIQFQEMGPLGKEEVTKMDTIQFADTIRQMYLPFTLRQMYYKELKRRRPIFLGASKKCVGFAASGTLNERTCLAQNIALTTLSNQSQRALSQVDLDLGSIVDPSLVISPVRLQAKASGTVKMKDRGVARRGSLDGDRQSVDKGIDMQSFGAMTGADPHVVKEIEQLMRAETNTDLRDISNKNRSIDSRGGGDIEDQVGEQKKSKVIFSVKKRNNEDSNLTIYKKKSNSNPHSSVDTGRQKASSALSQPSSKIHEVLDPRSRQFSPDKKFSSNANRLGKSPSAGDYGPQDARQMRMKQFQLKYATNQGSEEVMGTADCETFRTPQNMLREDHESQRRGGEELDRGNQESLKRINVSNVKIRISKDQSDKSKSPEQRGVRTSKEGLSQRGFPIRSFTCVDLEGGDLVKNRKLRASISDGLQRTTSHPDNKISNSKGTGGSKSKQQNQPQLNIASNSNIESRHKQNKASQQAPQEIIQVSLPVNMDWQGGNDQEDIAEIGTPHHRIVESAMPNLPSKRRTLSPSILNLELNTPGAFGQKVPNQLTSSLRISAQFSGQHYGQKAGGQHRGSSPDDQGDAKTRPRQQLRKKLSIISGTKSKSKLRNSPTAADRNSRGSFYISEDSQRTLTPLSCKDQPHSNAQQQHSQGFIMHRGNKFYQMQRLRHKKQGRSDSRLSRTSSMRRKHVYHKHPHQGNCTDCNKGDYTEVPECTCSKQAGHHKSGLTSTEKRRANRVTLNANLTLTGQCSVDLKERQNLDQRVQCLTTSHSQKFDQIIIQKQQSGSTANGGQNRVVFVVRNDSHEFHGGILPKNTDLVHLPIGETDLKDKINRDSRSQTVYVQKAKTQYAKNPNLNTAQKKPIKDEVINSSQAVIELKTSQSNLMDYSIKQSAQKLALTSQSVRDSHNSRNYMQKQEVSDGKCLSNQSSANIAFSHMMPAVEAQKEALAKLNNSYAEMIIPQEKPKKSLFNNAKRQAGETAKVEVKMRISKNPNQCPPRFTRRRRSSNQRPQTTVPKKSIIKDERKNPNGIISIQVQNEVAVPVEQQKPDKKQATLEAPKHPNYNSLQPYTIVSTDELTETVLSIAQASQSNDGRVTFGAEI